MARRKKRGSPVAIWILVILVAGIACAFYTGIVKPPKFASTANIFKPKAAEVANVADNASPEVAFAVVGGLPKSKSAVDILPNIGYEVGFDEKLMDPLWSAYYCGPRKKYEASDRSKIQFHPDGRVPYACRLKTSDYKRPPDSSVTYDRGHLSPNYAIATRYGNSAQTETFLLTNIVPQRSEMNQQTWRYLEQKIAGTYAPDLDGVWVIVGPVFLKNPDRYNGKAAIPDALYCIILDRDEKTGKLRALPLVMNQNVEGDHAIGKFATTVRNIESVTGLDFFSGLPDDEENALETAKPDAGWNLNAPLSQ